MPNLIYVNEEAVITWRDSGGTHALTFKGLLTNTGRQGATHDFGVDARSRLFRWSFFCQFDTGTPPVLGDVIEVYLKTGDGTNFDNDDGEGDIPVSSIDKLRNLLFLKPLVVDQAAVDVHMQISGLVRINAKEVIPVIWNATADTLDDDAAPTNSGFDLVPVPDEIQ